MLNKAEVFDPGGGILGVQPIEVTPLHSDDVALGLGLVVSSEVVNLDDGVALPESTQPRCNDRTIPVNTCYEVCG